MSSKTSGDIIQSHLRGDGNPTLFDFNSPITQEELMQLYVTCAALEKGVRWIPALVLSTGWEFKDNAPFPADKFGQPFTFESFTDWVKWNGSYEEILNAMAWALLFRRSRIFFYMSDEKPGYYKDTNKPFYDEIVEGTDVCTKAIAMYSLMNGNGWEVAEEDEDDEPLVYKVHVTNRETKYVDINHKLEDKIHYVHATRVVAFASPKKELGWEGTAKSQTIAHLSKLQKQMLQSVYVSIKNLIAGFLVTRSKDTDSTEAMNTLLQSFSHLTRLYWDGPEPLDDILTVMVPDFKADQLQSLNLMIQKSLASAMNISIRNLGEEDIASGLGEGGAGISHEITLFEVKEMQRFFQRPIEHCFYLMGKKNTTFVWNEPMMKDESMKEELKQKELEKNGNTPDGEKDNGKSKEQNIAKEKTA